MTTFLGIGKSKDQQAHVYCSLIESMIEILELISLRLKSGGGIDFDVAVGSSSMGIIEKVLSGEITVPDKVKNLAFSIIQAALN